MMDSTAIKKQSIQLIALMSKLNYRAYLFCIMTVATCTFIGFTLGDYINHSNLIMIYLLGVVMVATSEYQSYGPAVLGALLSTLAFDFFFITPFFSFSVSDIQYCFTLFVMLIVTQTISHLTIRAHRHQAEIRKAKLQSETDQLRSMLLASISHDLRTPLTAIMGSSSSLLQESNELNEAQKIELLNNIHDESKRLNRLVNNVLQIIRLESGSIQLNKQQYALEDIIQAALDVFRDDIANKGLTIKLDYAKYLPFILLDHILIEQVLINLIENAVKYAGDASFIKIVTRLINNTFIVKIVDHGPGIEPDEIETIFDPFYQGKESSDTSYGLGLAICKNIIAAHGGKIWAENRDQGGAIFCFTLPVNG